MPPWSPEGTSRHRYCSAAPTCQLVLHQFTYTEAIFLRRSADVVKICSARIALHHLLRDRHRPVALAYPSIIPSSSLRQFAPTLRKTNMHSLTMCYEPTALDDPPTPIYHTGSKQLYLFSTQLQHSRNISFKQKHCSSNVFTNIDAMKCESERSKTDQHQTSLNVFKAETTEGRRV